MEVALTADRCVHRREANRRRLGEATSAEATGRSRPGVLKTGVNSRRRKLDSRLDCSCSCRRQPCSGSQAAAVNRHDCSAAQQLSALGLRAIAQPPREQEDRPARQIGAARQTRRGLVVRTEERPAVVSTLEIGVMAGIEWCAGSSNADLVCPTLNHSLVCQPKITGRRASVTCRYAIWAPR